MKKPTTQTGCWLLAGFLALSASTALSQSEGVAADLNLEESIDQLDDFGASVEDRSGNEWLIAPVPGVNPTFGWTLAVPVARLYRPESLSPEDPAWITGVGVFYTENESWGGGLFHRMNLRNDHWRLMGGLAFSEVVYNYYGFGDVVGDEDQYIELKQVFGGGVAEALVGVAPNLYAGVRMQLMRTEVLDIRFPIPGEDYPGPVEGLRMDIFALVPRLVYDTRDNEFYPGQGTLMNAEVALSSKDFGSDFSYQLFKFDWNHYRSLADNQILAFRVALKYAGGSVPFFMLPAMGQGGDLRGYVSGIYRDKILLTGQMEYRLRLTKRLGVVAFGGVGGVGSAWDEFGEALPSYGCGVRYVLAEENNISFRVDVARGDKSTEIYLGIGEAF